MPDKIIKKSLHKRTRQRDSLLRAIMSGADKSDKRCSYCISKNLEDCLVSPLDSSRCFECVRLNKSYCDVHGLTPDQLDRVSSQHFRLEEELEEAEDVLAEVAAKVSRLRKQKRVWYDRMRRAVARGISDLEELDRVEREEAEAAARQVPTSASNLPVSVPSSSVDAVDWSAYDFDPLLLQDLGSGGIPAESPERS
jgi:hypothetical protein